ncbi:MAG: ADP-ribosylglycohydrolase family protein, partial [Planctomycetota bacterium]
GLAESLIECGALDADHLAKRWAENLDPMRGYGPGARRLLSRIRKGEDWRVANRSVFPNGSFGNGAAMRAAPLGLFFHGNEKALRQAAELASSITHAHPLGIEGGVLIARAVALVLEEPFEPERYLSRLFDFCTEEEFRQRLATAKSWLDREPSPAEVRSRLGTSILAHESAVTGVHAFVRHGNDFQAMADAIIDLGGDTDTIGAMAGGIFGACHGTGALPPSLIGRLEARERLEDLGRALFASRREREGESGP